MDFRRFHTLNFSSFLNIFEKEIIFGIMDSLSKSKTNMERIQRDFLRVLDFKYSKNMKNLLLVDVLQNIVNGVSAYSYSEQTRTSIKRILKKAKRSKYHQFFENNFENALSLLIEDKQPVTPQTNTEDDQEVQNEAENPTITAYSANLTFLELMRELAIAAENLEGKEPEDENSIKRSGVEFLDLFFDFLNYFSGYHSLNNFEQNGDLSSLPDNFYIDSVLSFEGLDQMQEYAWEHEFGQWRDHLLLRTFSINNNRNHFPVIVNTSNTYFYCQRVLEITNSPLENWAFIDFNQ